MRFISNTSIAFFDYLEEACVPELREFTELFSRNPIEDWKLELSERIRYESCILKYLTK